MNGINKSEVLASSVLGSELDASEIGVLAERMGILSLAPGESLVDEGGSRRTLYILARGCLCVCKAVGQSQEHVYEMKPGECAGTRAFVDGSERKAGLRAEDRVTVLTLEPEDFESLIDTHPRLIYKVMRAIFRVTHSNLMRMNLETAEMRNYVRGTGGRY
jgi:CRP/FNR family transcriptional regulator, cyclic AMP receptor protein